MKADRQSATAAGVALARSLEHRRPAGERILEDAYAAAFVPDGTWRSAATGAFAGWIATRVFGALMPGMIEFVAARGRYADELTLARTADGIDQLLVLGAGFDTAALRLAPALTGVRVFEIDHPATQRAKRAEAARIAPERAALVHFVEVDFERDDLAERLTTAGFDASRRSIVTWMGVTYYLTAEAFTGTLETLSRLTPPGSILSFDYVIPSVIDGTYPHRAATVGTRRAARMGEPFLLGFEPGDVGPLLSRHGFRLVEQATADALALRYTGGRRGSVGFAFVATAEREA